MQKSASNSDFTTDNAETRKLRAASAGGGRGGVGGGGSGSFSSVGGRGTVRAAGGGLGGTGRRGISIRGSVGLLQDTNVGGAMGGAGLLSTTGGPAKPRAIGPKAWLKMNEEGICTPVTIDKHSLSSLLRVPMRDLRMLEPNFSNSYSAAILCRERCMVVHLEQVRLLITAEEVYLQDGRNTTVTKYLPELQRRLLMRKLKLMDSHGVPTIYPSAAAAKNTYGNGGAYDDYGFENRYGDHVEESEPDGGVRQEEGVVGEEDVSLEVGSSPATQTSGSLVVDDDIAFRGGVVHEPGKCVGDATGDRKGASEDMRFKAKLSPLGHSIDTSSDDGPPVVGSPPVVIGRHSSGGGGGGGGRNSGGGTDHGGIPRNSYNFGEKRNDNARQEDLPFELIALEVALEIACHQLEREQRDVGNEARPALEGLRRKVSTVNLESVRRIKSRITRITGRVSKVREEVQRYLDDDSDMRDMYLTRKLLAELFLSMGPTSGNSGQGPGGGGGSGNFYSPRFSMSHQKTQHLLRFRPKILNSKF